MIPLVLVLAGVGFAAVLLGTRSIKRAPTGQVISYEPAVVSVLKPPSVTVPPTYVPAYTIGNFTPEIVASALKWARARGVPVEEILATIYVESRGNPRAWANLSTEDSRGLMQVNVNAWGSKLAARGYSESDLWDIDKNIEIGSEIYATYRNNVLSWISQSGVPQSAPVDVLTRLAYKGPAYVKKKILAGEDASHPYANAEAAINNWKVAMNLASQVTSAIA